MLAVERRKKIVDIINKNKSVLVLELAKLFEVTGETIRGDLEKLEQQGVLVRTYGGATLVEASVSEMSVEERQTINFEGKHLIGKCAAELIKEGETIFLDASTSSLHVAQHIKHKKGITVISNAEKIIMELADCPNINVICTGGILRSKSMSYVGRIAEENILNNYYANKVFLSCRGVTLNRGLMDSNEQEAQVKKAMIQCSESVVFLCDHSKLGKLGFPVLAPLKKVDYLITDVFLDEKWKEEIDKNDIEVIVINDKKQENA